jgi:hypothetical protein
MEKCPSWEASSGLSGQEFSSLYSTRKYSTLFASCWHWTLSKNILTFTPYTFNILSRVCGDYIDGYWIDKWIYWTTQLHNSFTVHTLHNSQLSLFSSSEDSGSNSATTAATYSCGIPCHHSLTGNWNCQSWLSTSELYSPGTDHKENTVSDSYTVVWRHYRNGPHFLPLLRCLVTVVNKRFHCRLLTHSVHVTLNSNPVLPRQGVFFV